MVKDGGPAFPGKAPHFGVKGDVLGYHDQGGMSKRDWFAGQALQGRLASGQFGTDAMHLTVWAYEQADAMIKAKDADLMASRTPQRTEIELPSGAVATVRKAMSRDMSRAELAKTRSIRMSPG